MVELWSSHTLPSTQRSGDGTLGVMSVARVKHSAAVQSARRIAFHIACQSEARSMPRTRQNAVEARHALDASDTVIHNSSRSVGRPRSRLSPASHTSGPPKGRAHRALLAALTGLKSIQSLGEARRYCRCSWARSTLGCSLARPSHRPPLVARSQNDYPRYKDAPDSAVRSVRLWWSRLLALLAPRRRARRPATRTRWMMRRTTFVAHQTRRTCVSL